MAPFHDRLPELLERGLLSVIDEHTEGDRIQASILNHQQQRLEALNTLHQLRSDIQARHGIYDWKSIQFNDLSDETNGLSWSTNGTHAQTNYFLYASKGLRR